MVKFQLQKLIFLTWIWRWVQNPTYKLTPKLSDAVSEQVKHLNILIHLHVSTYGSDSFIIALSLPESDASGMHVFYLLVSH